MLTQKRERKYPITKLICQHPILYWILRILQEWTECEAAERKGSNRETLRWGNRTAVM